VAVGLSHAAKYYETTGTSGRVTPTPRLAADLMWNTVAVAEAWRSVLAEEDRVLIMLPSDMVPVADLVAGVCEYLDLPHVRAYPFTTGICDWDRLLAMWMTFRPTTIFAAPGVALQFTRLLRQRGIIDDAARTIRAQMLLGEVNTGPLRRRMGAWWDCAVYDASYGSTETGTLAATCAADRQHLLTAASYFELATADGIVPLPEKGRGRLVVTPLNLYARPLLRLDTGDEVTVGGECACGNQMPVVIVAGRSTDAVRVHGVRLSPRSVEEVVYTHTRATGYMIEVSPEGERARLLLERDTEWDRASEPALQEAVQRASRAELGFGWDDLVFVNALPTTTKSGASQKSWKRSNIRTLAEAER
jgi:phenylacetate-CoA ligase